MNCPLPFPLKGTWDRGILSLKGEEDVKQSGVGEWMDEIYHCAQWRGEHWFLEQLEREKGTLLTDGEIFSESVLWWAWYLSRYWHFVYGISSKEINDIVNAEDLLASYTPYHILGWDRAIELIIDDTKKRN